MGIRFYKPYTPGTRNRSMAEFDQITETKPDKQLTSWIPRSKGRNNRGIITSRHRGGGHKKLYRNIDFRRDKLGILGQIATIEYDPNRNARIAKVHYQDGEKRYILYPRGLQLGQSVVSNFNAPIALGNSLPLHQIPLGTEIHNIELKPGFWWGN